MITESPEALALLTEADFDDFCLRLARDLQEHPSQENYERGIRIFANLPVPDTYGPEKWETGQSLYELWSAICLVHKAIHGY